MRHRTSRRFWDCYRALPRGVQRLADANHALLVADERHPSLQFKKAGRFWSVRVGPHIAPWALKKERMWSGSGSVSMPSTIGWSAADRAGIGR